MTKIEKASALCGVLGADACLITSPENRRYLTGLRSSSAAVLLTASGNAYYITDFRYIEDSKAQLAAEGFSIVMENGNLLSAIDRICQEERLSSLAFEDGYITQRDYTHWEKTLQIDLISMGDSLATLRQIKDDYELDCIKTSLQIAEQSLEEAFSEAKAGMSEQEFSARLTYHLLKNGSEFGEFGIVAVSGTKSALPHGKASDKPLAYGDFLLVDFGAIYQGYYSDITRTVAIGNATPKMEAVYDTVLKANLAGISAIQAGKTGKEIDSAARAVIADAGYGDYFLHGLGHGVGQEIHERPKLASTSEDILAKGNVVTVEPGIYLPNEFGVRIEDMLLVTDKGAQNLTRMEKGLRVL